MSDKLLSVAEMLAAEDIEYVTVPTPEWAQGSVKLGSIDAGSMIAFSEANTGASIKDSSLRLLVYSFVNEDGSRVAEADVDVTIAGLKKKNVRVINRLAAAALKLNGIGGDIKNVSGEAAADVPPTA